ncbi:hypothetical protein ACDW_21190 [Acidovorax sp. DW039]|uniref:hypothetical protein n=1 Tax=Acidovorax sp. DW039 TaxID=3095606 RepID=UPI0030925518|nr:hypothetical protein ACDW_21190 [Acidovorax sp. DW039]
MSLLRTVFSVSFLCASLSTLALAASDEASKEREGSAAAAQRAEQKAEIARERARNTESRKQAEARCYKLFAVEDCLREARSQWREVETRLRAQEVQVNDAERKEKARERLRIIEEKQSSPAVPAAAGASSPMPAASATIRAPHGAGRSGAKEKPPETQATRDREAAERAAQQRQRASTQEADQATRGKENAERAEKARQRQLEAQKTSEERRARRDKEKAEAAASGHQPSAPLPTPP